MMLVMMWMMWEMMLLMWVIHNDAIDDVIDDDADVDDDVIDVTGGGELPEPDGNNTPSGHLAHYPPAGHQLLYHKNQYIYERKRPLIIASCNPL